MPESSQDFDIDSAALGPPVGADGLPLYLAWDKWPLIICFQHIPRAPDPNRSWMRRVGEAVGLCRTGDPVRSRQLD
jgi:hypothetical protein